MAPPAGRSCALSAGAKKRKILRRRTVRLPRGLRRVMSMIPWADQADTVAGGARCGEPILGARAEGERWLVSTRGAAMLD